MLKKRSLFFALMSVCLSSDVKARETAQSEKSPSTSFKFGKGLEFVAKDSSASLKLGVRFQTLLAAERSLAEDADFEKEMSIRRFRIKMDGFAFSPRLVYKIELALSNRDNSSVIPQGANAANIVLDAVLKYQLNQNTELWFGQTKLPGNRERVISSQALQFVDRSLVNSYFNLDRDLGVQLHHEFNIGNIVIRDKWAMALGQGRNITMSDTGGFSYTGRIEVLPFGAFTGGGDYFDADFARESRPKLSVAAGYSYNDGAMREGGELGSFVGVQRDLSTFFADAMLKYRGWSLTTEFMDKRTDQSPVVPNTSNFFQTGYGWNLQSGYLFKNNIELAGRYTFVNPSQAIREAELMGKTDEYTVVVSKYFSRHNLKIQTDLSHTKDELDENGSIRYRLQVEMAL